MEGSCQISRYTLRERCKGRGKLALWPLLLSAPSFPSGMVLAPIPSLAPNGLFLERDTTCWNNFFCVPPRTHSSEAALGWGQWGEIPVMCQAPARAGRNVPLPKHCLILLLALPPREKGQISENCVLWKIEISLCFSPGTLRMPHMIKSLKCLSIFFYLSLWIWFFLRPSLSHPEAGFLWQATLWGHIWTYFGRPT